MSQNWMLVIPRHKERESIELVKLLQWMIDHDVHKWIIAKETGNSGYEHWQIRMANSLTFSEMKEKFPTAHIEEASNDYNYERKDGDFLSSSDTRQILSVRYGTLRKNQSRILETLDTQSDREIDIIIDRNGNTGKSWLARYLYEKGIGFYVPPTINSSQGIIQYVASGYGREDIIVIDIPRSTRWSPALYVCIETLKDGLIYDGRYHTTIRNIYGVKVLVFCNTAPNVDKLSKDRWRTYDAEGNPVKVCRSRRKKAADLSDPIS